MAFVVFHLNEPGRPSGRIAIALHHIISVREVADDAGTEIKLTDGTMVNVCLTSAPVEQIRQIA
jgi:hypothetical protein